MRPRALLLTSTAALLAATSIAAFAPSTGASPATANRAAPTARPRAATTSVDWPTYGGAANRAGWDRHMPRFRGGLHVVRRIPLDSAVYAQPIVAAGLTIVATENDTVYAFTARNQLVWKRHLGSPAPQSSLPCGNINPLGITGTPVYYPALKLVYVAAEFAGRPAYHRLFALRVGNGRVVSNRGLDFAGVSREAMQERGALTITAKRVWVPFGGLAGDCSNYKGRVVGYPIGRAGAPAVFTVPTTREAGIWTPPGPTVGPSGNLNVAVGNGAGTSRGGYDYSDSVLRLNGNGKRIDSFSPTTWRTDNANDLDLGSQGPALVANRWVFQAGKSGTVYVLRIGHLGGIGGAVSRRQICHSFGGTAVSGSRVFVPCTDGIRDISIGPRGWPRVLWHANGAISGTPVLGAGVVWSLDPYGGVLYALNVYRGSIVGSVNVGSVSRFAAPALSGRRILVGTMSGLTVVSY